MLLLSPHPQPAQQRTNHRNGELAATGTAAFVRSTVVRVLRWYGEDLLNGSEVASTCEVPGRPGDKGTIRSVALHYPLVRQFH